MYTSFTSGKKMHTKNNKNSSTQRNMLSFQNPTLKAPEARPETSGRRPSFAITEPAIPKTQTTPIVVEKVNCIKKIQKLTKIKSKGLSICITNPTKKMSVASSFPCIKIPACSSSPPCIKNELKN